MGMRKIPKFDESELEDPFKKFLNDKNYKYPFYALLLGRTADKFLADFVDKNWNALHYMNGNNCLIFSSFSSSHINPDIVNFWEHKLGDESLEDIIGLSANPDKSFLLKDNLKGFEELPGIFISTPTSLIEKKGVYAKIPNWKEENLIKIFEFFATELKSINKMKLKDNNIILGEIKDRIASKTYWNYGKIYLKNNWVNIVNPKILYIYFILPILSRKMPLPD